MQNYRYDDLVNQICSNSLLMPLDVLLVGGTGTGKSSTLNALFGSNIAKIGDGVDPETQVISSYRLHDYLRIHDSAGLGDGKAADLEHAKNITAKLHQTCAVGGSTYGFIDLVLVLLDGGSRDLGTAFRLLESVVLKSIHPSRVIVAINQADVAMKGRGWNASRQQPDGELKSFLDEKSQSVQRRIKESTGLSISTPVYYSALHEYNLDRLMDSMIKHLPTKRRPVNDVSAASLQIQ